MYPQGFQLCPQARWQKRGAVIQAVETKPFEDCINTCEVHELRSIGPYFTWTNRTIWIRIDRALVNTLWYDQCAFSQVVYMANSSSDHTALIIDTPSYPKPPSTFQFYDMWTRDSNFLPLVASQFNTSPQQGASHALKRFLGKTRKVLKQLHGSHFADLKAQQSIARAELEQAQVQLQNDPMNTQLIQKEKAQRDHYIKLLTSVIDIINSNARQNGSLIGMTIQGTCLQEPNKGKLLYTFMNCKMNKVEVFKGFQQQLPSCKTTIRGCWESRTPREDKLTPK